MKVKRRPTCEYCGTPDFLVKTYVLEGRPDSAIHLCARCDDTIHHGTELQKATLLLQSLEMLTRYANQETIKLLPGLTRNQRRPGRRRQGEENSFLAQRVHPTQKPVRLMDWCLDLCGLADNSLVVDPYMGSATTGIAALRRGHRFIGMELDPRHFETAVKRIEAEVVALESRTQWDLL